MVAITSLIALALTALPGSLGHPLNEIRQVDRGDCLSTPPPEFLEVAAQVAAGEAAGGDILSVGLTASINGVTRRQSASVTVQASTSLTIQTYVHIVAASNKSSDGWVSDDSITKQIDVLNTNYSPLKIRFVLAGVDRTINATWATNTPGTELAMKTTLRKGDYRALNLYYLKTLQYYALGYCNFPGKYKTNTTQFYMDGCVQRYDTMPGGNLKNFNQGKTTSHEVGHWFGLLHTFQGNNCTGSGDMISDTPAQANSTYGCPSSRDSCPSQPGADPIHNYMDYSFDSCYTNFTPNQKTRMYNMYQLYRANAK